MTNTVTHDHRPQKEQEQAPVERPQIKKKQARKRTHASRPYQERLINMAEARREIVTALKIHRANMRQQPTYQHQEPPLPRRSPPLQLRRGQQEQQQQAQVLFQDQRSCQGVEEDHQLRRLLPAPTSYVSFGADHQLCNPLAHWIPAADPDGGSYYSPPVLPYDLAPLGTPTAVAMGGLEQLARSLPAQPQGLNLSFQGFGGSMDGAKDEDCEGLFGVPLIQSSSPPASSYSAYSPPGTEMASGTHGSPALSTTEKSYSPVDAPAALIPAPDDGETQGVEWSEATTAADVATASAWWSKILLESMESGGAEGGAVGCTAEDVAAAAAAGLPAEWRWFCGVGEQVAATGGDDKPPGVLETMLADGHCYKGGRRTDGAGDIALPCMDDDDIGGWDGDWGVAVLES